MKKNSILITVVSTIVLVIFLYVIYVIINNSSITVNEEVNKILPDDHVAWSTERNNVLVEYSDYECPACRVYHTFLNSLEASDSPNLNITKKVTLVFRTFPLYQIHPNSYQLAYAAEAAGKQNKFFEMSTALFNDQDRISKIEGTQNLQVEIVGLAKELGINIDQFQKDMQQSQEIKNKVSRDLLSGEKAGIDATPTFFLNGKKLDLQTPDDLKKILEAL